MNTYQILEDILDMVDGGLIPKPLLPLVDSAYHEGSRRERTLASGIICCVQTLAPGTAFPLADAERAARDAEKAKALANFRERYPDAEPGEPEDINPED